MMEKELDILGLPILQIKLGNGDELLCQVGPGDDESIDVYHSLQIEPMDQVDNEHYNILYVLKPWMLYQAEFNNPVKLMKSQIVATYNPDPMICTQYMGTIGEIYKKVAEMIEDDLGSTDSAASSIFQGSVVKFPTGKDAE